MDTSRKTRRGKESTPIFVDKNTDKADIGFWADIAVKMMLNVESIAKRYGADIEADDFWQTLAMKLMVQHEPSMKIKSREKVGRPTTWTKEKYAELYIEVELLRSQSLIKPPVKNVTTICKTLAKQEKWQATGIETGKSLQTRYSLAKQTPLVKMLNYSERAHPNKQIEFLQDALEHLRSGES